MTAMTITPPFGFTEVVALEKHHRVRRAGALPTFYATQNAIPVSVGEFVTVMRDLPIVFAPLGDGPQPAGFLPVAVCGLAPGENLLIADGQWESNVYVPAYLRRHPFCVALGPANGEQRPAIICVEKSALADDGEPLVNADGSPTEAWTQAQTFVNEVESDLARTQQFAKLLHDLKVLDGFTMTSTQPGGQELRVTGMYRVNEEKLKALTADQLRMLIDRGAMPLIYLHIASIERFPLLVQRRAARAQAAQAAA